MKSPRTVQQLQSFLGLVNYCRSWIPDCAVHDRYLRNLIDHKAPPNSLLNWTEEAELHYTVLKQATTTVPALGLPDYSKDCHLHAREAEGVAIGVLLQQHGYTYRPLAYLSKKLDNIASGMPACLHAVAAAALIVQMTARLILDSCLTCAKVNPHRPIKLEALPHPEAQFQNLQIDFTHMPPIGN
uniref:Reverse transcriptase/retrotransposon-derived protein RNase H-like domain-containing protein n=1 Tax=Sinocyclocheilus grahami TaxID=75366 RepID=A0A672L8R2_SINGR